MDDYIMRQDAINTHCAICPDKDKCPDGDFICPDRELFRMIKPAYPDLDESCEDCPVYDKEKHFFPRFSRVIPDTIKELKQNAQPEIIRCKDCKFATWYDAVDGVKRCFCDIHGSAGHTETDFCSYAEREEMD